MLPRASAAVDQVPADESEALAALALEYRSRSARFASARTAAIAEAGTADARSAAAHIVLWFHSRIYFTTMRALVGKAVTAAGRPYREASVCAGATLVAINRSRAALQQLSDEDGECRALLTLLDALARGIEERFPSAHAVPRAAAPANGPSDAEPRHCWDSSTAAARPIKSANGSNRR